jgi:hypothetical protein
MKVEYELKKEDYINFNIYHIKNSKVIRKTLLAQRYIVPIIFLVIPLLFGRFNEIPFFPLSIALIWIIFYPKYFMSVTMKRVSKMIEEGKNNDLLGNHIVIVDEEGLVEKSKNGENSINWMGVERIVSTESYFFIYVSSISACIVPKSSFDNESSRDIFFEFINRKLDQSRK